MFKGGFPAWSVMGESNASLMTCEPLVYKPQWGASGPAKQATSLTFMAQAAIDAGVPERLGLRKRLACTARHPRAQRRATSSTTTRCRRSRSIPETYRVEVDGELCTCEPMSEVPLGRRYVLK